jgi:nitroreductase
MRGQTAGIMAELNDLSSVLKFLKTRKSASAKALGAPGPTRSELGEMLDIAVRAPDHGKLTPWRFIVFEGEARAKIGEAFAGRWQVLHPGHGDEILAFHRALFLRAPTVVAVVSTAATHAKIPEWEQLLSSAAVCYNIVLAATAMGYHAQWQTDWVAYDAETRAAMGLKATERISGLVYLGTSTAPLEERPRPDAKALTTRWGA